MLMAVVVVVVVFVFADAGADKSLVWRLLRLQRLLIRKKLAAFDSDCDVSSSATRLNNMDDEVDGHVGADLGFKLLLRATLNRRLVRVIKPEGFLS